MTLIFSPETLLQKWQLAKVVNFLKSFFRNRVIWLPFFLKVHLLYMSGCSVCIDIFVTYAHACIVPMEARRCGYALELELQMMVNQTVSNENWTWSSVKSNLLLRTWSLFIASKSSLQASSLHYWPKYMALPC